MPTSPPREEGLDQSGSIVSKRSNNSQHPSVPSNSQRSLSKATFLYLRLLLHQVPARSFNTLRTVGNTVHEPFYDAARARVLFTGDEEYFICMEEATVFQTVHKQLHGLFVPFVSDGGPAPKLLNCVKDALLEDLMPHFSRATAKFEALRQIDLKWQFHEKIGRRRQLSCRYSLSKRQTAPERMVDAFDRSAETRCATNLRATPDK